MHANSSDRRFMHAAATVAAATAGVLALSLLPPFVEAPWREGLHAAFSFVCHQLPGRTLHVDGTPVAVCHRCLGIFAALPLGALAALRLAPYAGALRRRAGAVLLVAVAVPGADWALGALGLWANTPLSRGLTGAVFGGVAGLYVVLSAARPAPRPSPVAAGGGG